MGYFICKSQCKSLWSIVHVFIKNGMCRTWGEGGQFFKFPRLVAVLGSKYQIPGCQPSALTQPHIRKRLP